jgi:hypothetical protein
VAVDPITRQPVQPACNTAGYPAYRYRALIDAFGDRGLADDVCRPDFGASLRAIAGELAPGQTMPLAGAPADWRLLQVALRKAGGAEVACRVGLPGASAAEAEAVYREPQAGQPASLTFQGTCQLERGDSVQVRVLCAG